MNLDALLVAFAWISPTNWCEYHYQISNRPFNLICVILKVIVWGNRLWLSRRLVSLIKLEKIKVSSFHFVWTFNNTHGSCEPRSKVTALRFSWFCKLLFTKKCCIYFLNLGLKCIKPGNEKQEREHDYVKNRLLFCVLRLPRMQLMVTWVVINRYLQCV